MDEGFRADMIVQGKVIVELKSVERVGAAHQKQLPTYLKLSGLKPSYLLNFGRSPDEGRTHQNHQWAPLSKNLRVPGVHARASMPGPP